MPDDLDVLDVADRLWRGEIQIEQAHPFAPRGGVAEVGNGFAFVPSFGGAAAVAGTVLSRYREMVEQARTIGFAPTVPEGLGPGRLADAVAAGVALPLEARQQLLETLDPRERLEKLSGFLS